MKTPLICVAMVAALTLPSFATAQTAGTQRDVQIRTIDFVTQTLELHNFGSTTYALDGWRFCSHDESAGFRYTGSAGLNGQSLAAGASLFFDWDNNGSGSTINVSSLGGAAIVDLVADSLGEAVQLGIYRTGSFGTASELVDHIQYSWNGADVDGADNRGTPAEGSGLWADRDDWIATTANSTSVALNVDPFPGAVAAHGASSYSVSAVPEPSAIAFLAIGAAGFAGLRRRR